MQQQHQILQSLNQCYAQLQQQHQDMATLQQQFQQLFTYNPSAVGDSNPSPHTPQAAFPSVINNASPASFRSLPSVLQPPFSAPVFSQPPSSAPMFRTAWHPTCGQQVCSFYKLSKRLSGNMKLIFWITICVKVHLTLKRRAGKGMMNVMNLESCCLTLTRNS